MLAQADRLDAADHDRRARAFADALARACTLDGAERTLDKPLSNLFRDRAIKDRGLPAAELVHVLAIDTDAGHVDVEGMIPYDALVEATLPRGVMPRVVPQLKSITVGGAVAGIGIEATSFRHGLVHETVLEMDVALPDGSIVTCTPDNEHADLLAGMANSYGTLGYATRLRIETQPVKDYVARGVSSGTGASTTATLSSRHSPRPTTTPQSTSWTAWPSPPTSSCSPRGVSSTTRRMSATTRSSTSTIVRCAPGRRTSSPPRTTSGAGTRTGSGAPRTSGRSTPLVRQILGRERLGSRFYQRVMRWNSRWRLSWRPQPPTAAGGYRRESIIQDVDLPLATAPEFLDTFMREIGILPVWVCPVRDRGTVAAPLFPAPAEKYVAAGTNVQRPVLSVQRHGVPRRQRPGPPQVRFLGHPAVRRGGSATRLIAEGHFNRIVEEAVTRLGGIKSLYSSSFYGEDEFRRIYGGEAYRILKQRYDPDMALAQTHGELYAKCVRRR